MAKFKIDSEKINRKSVNRSVRFAPAVYDKLVELAKVHGISFNKMVSLCVEYSMDNLDASLKKSTRKKKSS